MRAADYRNVVLVGTDFTEEAAGYLGLPPPFPKQFHDVFIDRLKRAYKIGVTMAYGTDVFVAVQGKTRGMLAISFIDSFVEAGVPPKDILRIMTTNAARLLGVDKQRGVIKVGQAADIIATPERKAEPFRKDDGKAAPTGDGKSRTSHQAFSSGNPAFNKTLVAVVLKRLSC